MKRSFKIAVLILSLLAVALGLFLYLQEANIPVLQPKGWIGMQQRDLIYTSTLLMLIVVIPALVLTFVFAWKYREGNKGAKYTPNWDYDLISEAIWWGLPCVIVAILSVMVWTSSHKLDPFKPLVSDRQPLRIQVVALQWKWLFIYPEQKIATVNFVEFPEGTPINFEITADAPMNSFWIPQLGGQIYAMAGMKTKLHLIANETGSFRGSSSNLSGSGFSGMVFTAKAVAEGEFADWVQSIQACPDRLTLETYNQLALPSKNNPVATYVLGDDGLYEQIVMKYGPPMEGMEPKP